MRTRRSPRNQERLWRALGGTPEPKRDTTSVEAIERMLAGLPAHTSPRVRGQFERDLARAKMKATERGGS